MYIKKYVIHILAVTAISESVFDIPLEDCAMITLTTRTTPGLNRIKIRKLVVDIQDVESTELYGAFTREHARMIIKFISNLPECITDLYICCSKGGSRSTGCAAALMLMSNRSDDDVWKNPYYTPNYLVFRELCREFGIDMSDEAVADRLRINDEAYKTAQENKNAGKYERWQILM